MYQQTTRSKFGANIFNWTKFVKICCITIVELFLVVATEIQFANIFGNGSFNDKQKIFECYMSILANKWIYMVLNTIILGLHVLIIYWTQENSNPKCQKFRCICALGIPPSLFIPNIVIPPHYCTIDFSFVSDMYAPDTKIWMTCKKIHCWAWQGIIVNFHRCINVSHV